MKELKPIRESTKYYDALEELILKLLKREIYEPLISILKPRVHPLRNSLSSLLDAIVSGRLTFYRGYFRGSLNSTLTRELRKLGAEWDSKRGLFAIPQSELPSEIKQAILASKSRLEKSLESIDRKLSEVIPEEIADKFSAEKIFDKTLYTVEEEFKQSVKNVAVPPTITPEMRSRIAKEYTQNLQLYIKEFAEKEILDLRENIKKRTLSGLRYESVVDEIKKSYGVTQNKAKFLARQETSLMITKYKQTRYEDAGVNEYRWKCVAGSANHPVRPLHKKNEGKIFTWDSPPIVDEQGNRKNPGQDYNCRCYAVPVVRF